jgi:hypothetical protein
MPPIGPVSAAAPVMPPSEETPVRFDGVAEGAWRTGMAALRTPLDIAEEATAQLDDVDALLRWGIRAATTETLARLGVAPPAWMPDNPLPLMRSHLAQRIEAGNPSMMGGRATPTESFLRVLPPFSVGFAIHDTYRACQKPSAEACADAVGSFVGNAVLMGLVAVRAPGMAEVAPEPNAVPKASPGSPFEPGEFGEQAVTREHAGRPNPFRMPDEPEFATTRIDNENLGGRRGHLRLVPPLRPEASASFNLGPPRLIPVGPEVEVPVLGEHAAHWVEGKTVAVEPSPSYEGVLRNFIDTPAALIDEVVGPMLREEGRGTVCDYLPDPSKTVRISASHLQGQVEPLEIRLAARQLNALAQAKENGVNAVSAEGLVKVADHHGNFAVALVTGRIGRSVPIEDVQLMVGRNRATGRPAWDGVPADVLNALGTDTTLRTMDMNLRAQAEGGFTLIGPRYRLDLTTGESVLIEAFGSKDWEPASSPARLQPELDFRNEVARHLGRPTIEMPSPTEGNVEP